MRAIPITQHVSLNKKLKYLKDSKFLSKLDLSKRKIKRTKKKGKQTYYF